MKNDNSYQQTNNSWWVEQVHRYHVYFWKKKLGNSLINDDKAYKEGVTWFCLLLNDGGPNSFAHKVAQPPYIWRCERFIWRHNAYLHGKCLTLHSCINSNSHVFLFFIFILNILFSFFFFFLSIAYYSHAALYKERLPFISL
jgi:hypothetical protein